MRVTNSTPFFSLVIKDETPHPSTPCPAILPLDDDLTKSQFEEGKKLFEQGRYSEAFKRFLITAERGYARAQNGLGICYAEGKGVEKNPSEAVKYYRLAAE